MEFTVQVYGLISQISKSFDLRRESICVISDLVEFRCSQDTDVSVGPPAQAQLLAVSWDKDTKRYHMCELNPYRTNPVKHTKTRTHLQERQQKSLCVYLA